MNVEGIAKLTGNADITVVEAMAQIDKNARGILFIVDDKRKLVGSLTDGDIRRWIIRTGNINAKVRDVMNPNPKYLFESTQAEGFGFMKENSINAVPIVNVEIELIDIVTLDERDFDKEDGEDTHLADVPVVIMAGGEGTRLRPYTKVLPKPLIPIIDTPILERIINRFTTYGVRKLYLTVNYKKELIKAYFAELKGDYELEYIEEDKPLGTAGSIGLMNKKPDVPIIVSNCDSLILTDYAELYRYHKDSGNVITMVSSLKNITIPYGVLETGENGRVDTIKEKPKLSYLINTGMYVINPEVIDMIPKDELFHMTDLVNKILEKGGRIGTFPISEDSFLDMGEMEEMRRMENRIEAFEAKN